MIQMERGTWEGVRFILSPKPFAQTPPLTVIAQARGKASRSKELHQQALGQLRKSWRRDDS